MYPDLIAAIRDDGGIERMLVLETKGGHLDNPDSDYKRTLLQTLSGAYRGFEPVGEMTLEWGDAPAMHCELVLDSDWQTRLRALTAVGG